MMRRGLPGLLTATALVAGLVAVAGPVSAAPAPTTVTCEPWRSSTVASGLGLLENLAFDGRGGLLLSKSALVGDGALIRLAADGSARTVVDKVTSPGGVVVDGDRAYFTTGNAPASGLFGKADGTVDVVDLGGAGQETMATGLVMPNGLARLGDGDLLVTRNVGTPGLTRVPVQAPHLPEVVRTDLGTVNGLAIHESRVYTATTFDARTYLRILDAEDLAGSVTSIPLPGFGLINVADDLTVGPDGAVYIAYNVAGKVIRVDPNTGESCTIASGLPLTSSVRFGAGPGWDANALYATSFLGTVRKLERA